MNKTTAKTILDLAFHVSDQLVGSQSSMKESGSEDEIRNYRHAIATVMATLADEIINPICRQYPELTPEGLTIASGRDSCTIHARVGFTSRDKQ